MILGDERKIYIQITLNKRRRRRGNKKEKKHTLKLIKRVLHVFRHGRIKDFIHPREIDPYWGILYRHYELLTYIDQYYRFQILDYNEYLTKEEKITIIKDLSIIKRIKDDLMYYMMNFMNLLYGSVLKNRFYGWKQKYSDEFISLFTYVTLKNINELKFDINKTRCSVYFYQAFWLSGIGLTKDISNRLKKEGIEIKSYGKCRDEDYDDEENIDPDKFREIMDIFIKNERISNIGDHKRLEIEYNNDERDNKIDKGIIALSPQQEINIDHDEIDNIEYNENYDEEQEEQEKLNIDKLITYLLDKLNISKDYIYENETNTKFNKLGKHIKNKIMKGELKLDNEVKNILKKLGFNKFLKKYEKKFN